MSTGDTLPGKTTRVLHVDSDPDVPEALADTLESEAGDFEVVAETDPVDALARFDVSAFDCLVTGYDFPTMTGIDLLDTVRKRDGSFPVILFPGEGNEAVASRAISAGVTEYVRKQSGQESFDSLARRIQEILAERQANSDTGTGYDNSHLERFLRAFPDTAFVIDEEGRYLDFITVGDRSLLAGDVDDLLGRRYHDVLPEDKADRFLDIVRKALESGEQQQLEYQLEVERGRRWFEARVGPLETESERPTAFWIARDITARKRREREYEEILNGVPDPITVNDPETGELLEVNDAMCETLGYEKGTILRKGIDGLAVPGEGDSAERAGDIVNRVMESGEPESFEWKLEAADGSHRVLEVTGTPAEINGEDRYVSLTRDITERRQREREYEQIFNNVNDAITVFDPNTGEIADVNEAYKELLGYDDLETIRELGIEGLSADEADYTGERGWNLIREVSETGEAKTVDWRGETSDGEQLWLEATLAPAEIGGEERVLSIQRDITDRRELEQTYRAIFENVSDGLVIHDPRTGNILEANEQYCELTGYGREELLESSIHPIMPEDPEYTYENVLARIRKAREEGPQLFEFKGQRKDGDVFIAEVHLRTVEIRGSERVLASVRDITERKRRKREYEQIFNNVNEIIAVRDPENGEIVDVNQSYADLLGYDREEMQGMKISDVSVPEEGYDDEHGMDHLREAMESDEPVEFEWKVEDDQGRSHLMDVRGTTALINGEQRYLAIGRDITERKRRERAIETLQGATERLQTATTPEEVATIAVETASEVLGLPNVICWFHDEGNQRLEPAAATESVHEAGLVSELDADRYEYEAFVDGAVTEYTPREHGSHNHLESGVLLPLADDGLIAAATRQEAPADGTVLDIAKALADHVTTALDRVERAQAVRESERRFRLIAERIDEVIYLAEPDFSDVLYVNPAYEEVWGRPIDELESNARAFLEAVDHRDRESLEADFETMVEEIQTGDPDESYDFEYRIRQPDGELRWVKGTGYAAELPGEKRRFVGIVEDITERKRREQRLEVFNRILRHNLRNQLDVVRSHAEELAERADSDHAERILASVDELAAIGAEARETDRIMSMDEQLTAVRISETVRRAVETTEVSRNGVEIRTEIRPTSPLTTNEEAVQIAIESVLENAIEHADSTVTVSAEDERDRTIVTIEDDGPGIPDEQLVPIETGTETKLRHGRGLGLWQLRWSVDTFKGELSFDTTGGTSVRIEIPDQQVRK